MTAPIRSDRRPPARHRRKGRPRLRPVVAFSAIGFAVAFVVSGCTPAETRGTYQVEIEFTRSGPPIEGLLVLSTTLLDVPSPPESDRALLGEWIDDADLDATSCFILLSGVDGDDTPKNVRLFDPRLRGSELRLPVEIYRTPAQKLEITELEFFANAIGGEVRLEDRGDTRVGHIHGFRAGPPRGQRCVQDLERFREQLRAQLAP